MTFVALLAGGIVISISTALKVWQRVKEANELNQEARAVMEMISRDLRTAYVGMKRNGGFFLGAPPETGGSDLDTLFFTTQSSSAADLGLLPEEMLTDWDPQVETPVSDFVGVLWEWQEEARDGGGGLYRTTFMMPSLEITQQGETEEEDEGNPLVSGEYASEFVTDAVEELRFEYFDGESWAGSWDSRDQANRPPQAVAIEFTLRDLQDRGNDPRARVSKEKRRTFRTVVTLPPW
jgi:hypothetical protein